MAVITAAAVGVVSLGASIYASSKASGLAKDNMEMQKEQAEEQMKFQKEQQVKLDAQKKIYKDMEFTNPYDENVYEDLTINQQQAGFEKQMFQQSQADIMQNLKGAAGGSGVASLAQSLANQGQLASQRASASIGMQEAQNQKLKASGAQQKQAGEEKLQAQEMSRQSTLLGMEMGEMAGARAGVQSAQANQMAAGAAQVGAASDAAAGYAGMATSAFSTAGEMYDPKVNEFGPNPPPADSDRRLKKNINLIGKSSSGLNIYSFEYKDSKYGEGLFQGVMSDEIPQEAVNNINGYDTVDYSMLDVEFKQI